MIAYIERDFKMEKPDGTILGDVRLYRRIEMPIQPFIGMYLEVPDGDDDGEDCMEVDFITVSKGAVLLNVAAWDWGPEDVDIFDKDCPNQWDEQFEYATRGWISYEKMREELK